MKSILCSLCLLLCTCASAQSNINAGQQAPKINITDWVLNVPEDKNFDGKFVVLEFWATWCSPCIAAIPHLNELQEEFQRDDLYFVSMTDESLPLINRFLDRLDFKSIVVSDQSKQTHIGFGDGKEGLEAYPMTILIDPEGIVRWVGRPKQLTREVMGDFLDLTLPPTHLMKESATEEVVVVVEDAEDPSLLKQSTDEVKEDGKPDGAAPLDFNQFLSLYKNKSLTYLLEIKKASVSENSSMAVNEKAFFHTAIDLPELYKDLFGKTVYDSDFLKGQLFSITYLDKTAAKHDPELLERLILRSLNLKKETEPKQVTSHLIRIDDVDKLPPSKETGSSSLSNSDGVSVFSNVTLEQMIEAVAQSEDLYLTLVDSNEGTYDFIIRTETEEAIWESFSSYGLRVKSSTKTIKGVRLIEQ